MTHDVRETLAFARVLVVDDGRIVEDGDPRQLAAGRSRYRALLDAEAGLQAQAWGSAAWRRLELRDGVLVESPRVLPQAGARVEPLERARAEARRA
ncbi:MAG: hypothetical protein U1F56_21475 [Rubrivivax sp.]